MTQEKLLDSITAENMKHILPIVRNSKKLMDVIKSKLTHDVNANNEMIINEIKKEVKSYDEGRYLYYESFVLALIEIL